MILSVTVQEYIDTNAYFYVDDATHRGFLIDPGAEADRLLGIMETYEYTIEKILLTHGHFDHMGAAEAIQQKLSIPICMHKNGRPYAERPEYNLSRFSSKPISLKDVTYLEDGAVLSLTGTDACRLTVIPTPGHTEDGCIYYSAQDHAAFVGDTIFAGSYGRTDFYGGDEDTLFTSIREKILTLPPETTLLSGHSEPTTVADEQARPWYR